MYMYIHTCMYDVCHVIYMYQLVLVLAIGSSRHDADAGFPGPDPGVRVFPEIVRVWSSAERLGGGRTRGFAGRCRSGAAALRRPVKAPRR